MSENTMTTLQGWFKEAYADKIVDLIPDNVYYAKEAKPISKDAQPGGNYNQPVTLTSEQGMTLSAAAAGAFALNSPIAMASRQASIVGSQGLLRSAIDYETAFRSKNKNSFIDATKGVIENMLKSIYFYMEAEIMWGKRGIGIVSSISTNTITLTTAEFAPGLWLASEGRQLRIESSAGVLRGYCYISSWDIDNRTVTVDSAPAGIVATDVIYFGSAGASGANEMQGLYGVIATTTGTMFGISASTYGMWAPSSAYTAGSAPLTFNKIMMALTRAKNRGLGSDIREIDVVVNPYAYQNLLNDLAAGRNIDASYKSSVMENGAESLKFYSPAGTVYIISHDLMKEGFAFIHPKASRALNLIGCCPTPTFDLPGMVGGKAGEYIARMENNAGYETRLYWNTSIFTARRNQTILINNIVNATS